MTRITRALIVPLGAWLVGLLAYQPILGIPTVDPDDVTILTRARGASFGDLLLGRIDWDLRSTIGRSFRPLPILTYRFDFAGQLSSNHRLASLAWIALLALAVYLVIEHLCHGLSWSEWLLVSLLSIAFAVTLPAAESTILPTERSNTLLALATTGLVASLLRALRFDTQVASPDPRVLTAVGTCVLLCAASKENGAFVAVGAMITFVGIALFRGLATRRSAFTVFGVTAASLTVFYVYKVAALGTTADLVVPHKKAIENTNPWGIGWLDSLILHVTAHPSLHGPGIGASNAARNFFSTILPAFDEPGTVVTGRAPFLIPAALLLLLVVVAVIRLPQARWKLLALCVVVVVASASMYIGHRYRFLIPGEAVWVVAVGFAAVMLARSSTRITHGRVVGVLAAVVVAGALVDLALSYQFTNQTKMYAYQYLYGDETLQNPRYTAVLNRARARYGCHFLSDLERQGRSSSVWMRAAERVAHGPLWVPTPAKRWLEPGTCP